MASDHEFLEQELRRFRGSAKRGEMLCGVRYHRGEHDILLRERTALGKNGEVTRLPHLPNERIVDNQYARALEQKADFLLAKPIAFECDEEGLREHLRRFFNPGFLRLLKSVAKDALDCGIAWLHPYYTKEGRFTLRKFPGYEILPFWRDRAHTVLHCALRLYEREEFDGGKTERVEYAELYDREGITFFKVEREGLIFRRFEPYMMREGSPLCWDNVPLVPFRANEEEAPLIRRVKSLQDALNTAWSDWANGLQSSPYNEILVLKNYDGTDLAEFRRNLAAYGAVKVRTVDGTDGGLERMEVRPDSAGYQTVIRELKRAIVENAMGYDAKDLKSGNPNQMTLRSMYTDMELDANSMECEFRHSLTALLEFYLHHLALAGAGEYYGAKVSLTFNRDLLVDEGEILSGLVQAGVKVSNRTLLGQVPFVDDVAEEMERLEEEG